MLKLTFKQQILTGFAVSLIFVTISAIASYLSVLSLNDSYEWVQHTQEVTKTAEKLEIRLIHSESAMRGFVLTENADYRMPYDENIENILPLADNLIELLQDNPTQHQLADSIKFYAIQKVSDMKHIISLVEVGSIEGAKQQINKDKGRISKIKFLSFKDQLVSGEYKLLKERRQQASKRGTQTTIILVLSSIIIFSLILFLLSYIRKTFDQQKEIERKILETNKDLEDLSRKNEYHNWFLTNEAKVNEQMRGEANLDVLTTKIITCICTLFKFPIAALYLVDHQEKSLNFKAGFAVNNDAITKKYNFGEGLLGQTVLGTETRFFKSLPSDYLKISSALGETVPKQIICMPIAVNQTNIAAIEIGLANAPKAQELEFLDSISSNIGIAIQAAIAKEELQLLFEKTQQQAEELTSQQEELRVTNEVLIDKTAELQASDEELRVQQEELQQANAELEEKAQLLEEKNLSINQAKEAISIKAQELELSSKYKSEFLANMSHELRTPLNSILILARILKDNKNANLTEEQIKYAGVIQNAGSDLLTLINDILDLSKIESGTVELVIEEIKPILIKNNLQSLFTELAKQKNISFNIVVKDDVPAEILSDQIRLEQVVKNLLSNAFKFTANNGTVNLTIATVPATTAKNNKNLSKETLPLISFAVTDNGIGISADKQNVIFEAFKQEDGSTSRKYGGTGLGLSISRELANLLGGEIQLDSKVDFGSTFTLLIPQKLNVLVPTETPLPTTTESTATVVVDKINLKPQIVPFSNKLVKNNKLLIVEDDINFAEILKAYAMEKGFEPILAYSGDEGLAIAKAELPNAIVLDVMLPVMDGWSILKALKSDPETQHIPIHMMSAGDEKSKKAIKEGAIGFLKKPVEKHKLDHAFDLLMQQHNYDFNNILVIEDHTLHSDHLTEQLVAKGAKVFQAFTGKQAEQLLAENTFDCIILDLKLPDISGFDLLDKIKANAQTNNIPIVINTAMELDKEKMAHIMKYSQAMVLKSTKANDRLLDEVSLFMNKLKADKPKTIKNVKAPKNFAPTLETALQNKTILITDDDMRNIFALSSALQDYEMKIIIATNGKEALQKLDENLGIDLVLMDIMMPEMDGYEAMKAIRNQRKFANLPVIALTAKAMLSDREKCIEAGASDYISKPIDVDKLLSMIRVWLS